MELLAGSTVFNTLLSVLIVWVVSKLVKWVWLKPKKLEKWLRQQGLAGTSYKFLFGDMKDYSSMRSRALQAPMSAFSHDYLPRVEPLRHHLTAKFGRDYFVWIGPTPMVNISTSELVKEALTKMHEFKKPRLNPISGKLSPGLLSYEGDKWAKHRKLISTAFHTDKLKLMLPAFCNSCADMINKWEEMVSRTGSEEIDVWPCLTTMSADAISRAAFGSSYKDGQRIFELIKEQGDLAVHMLKSVYIPGLRYIPTARNRRFNKVQDQIQTLLKGTVNRRKAEIETGQSSKSDLLGILMDSSLGKLQMSLEEVIAECKLFYIAGQETTSLLLVWTLVLLSKHQDWQSRAREEVLQRFGNDAPNSEGLSHLKTVSMILYEVLRLYPPATQLTRRIYKNTKLADLSLPAGTLISLPVHFIHRDVEYWGDNADEFVPDRFSEGISKATNGTNTFFPFGWGPRVCLGERFAMTEAKIVLSMILQRFSFELSPSYVHAPMLTVVFLQPQYGAPLIFHRL